MDCILMIWFYDNKNYLKLQVNVVRDENRLPALAHSTKRIKFFKKRPKLHKLGYNVLLNVGCGQELKTEESGETTLYLGLHSPWIYSDSYTTDPCQL